MAEVPLAGVRVVDQNNAAVARDVALSLRTLAVAIHTTANSKANGIT